MTAAELKDMNHHFSVSLLYFLSLALRGDFVFLL